MVAKKSTPKHLESDDLQAHASGTPITDRVNVEPAILNGMTASEAQVIGLISLVLCLMLGGFLVIVTGLWQTLLLTAFFGPLAVLWFSSKYLAQIKRNRPDGYYSQAMHLWLSGRGFSSCKFINHDGYWSLGRTLPFSLASPFHVTAREASAPSPLEAHTVQGKASKA